MDSGPIRGSTKPKKKGERRLVDSQTCRVFGLAGAGHRQQLLRSSWPMGRRRSPWPVDRYARYGVTRRAMASPQKGLLG